ncbi:MAG: hypothetical protein ACYCZU_07785 [Devosia sp.]
MRQTPIVAAAALAAIFGNASAGLAQDGLTIPENGYVVSEDPTLLPAPVREKRERLLAAAKSGDMRRLKAIFDAEAAAPTVSFGQPEDPIAYLEQQSGDGEGLETLAILADLLTAPYAAMDGGDGDPIYVWPYLAAVEDLSALMPEQQVDGYRIMGYSGFKDMMEVGTWFYWRVYIGPEGQLQAFVAGD